MALPFRKNSPQTLRKASRASTATLELLQPVSRKQRFVRVFLLFVSVVALCWSLDLKGFSYLERYAADLRMSVYGAQHGSPSDWAKEHIVILALSDDSFDPTNNQVLPVTGPPVPRSYHAKIIRELKSAGAKVIAFDFMFTVPRPPDAEFAAAAREAGNVLWACRFQTENTENGAAQSLVLPLPTLLKASPHKGHIVAPKDEEQMAVTRIPAVIMNHGQQVPALSVVAAQMYLGLGDKPLRRTPHGWQCENLFIPVDDTGHFTIKYLGTEPGAVFQTLPYEKIYYDWLHSEDYQEKSKNPLLSLRDKIVLVGDTTSLGHDVVLTPLKEMVGVEVHAHAIATVLQNSFVHPVAPGIDLLILCAVTALVCAAAANWRSTWAVPFSIILLAFYASFNIWLFVEQGLVLRMVAPCAAILLATLAVVTERNLTVERAVNHARALLQRYVSPQIANYILAHPEKAALGGTRVTATVLFSDIRGFTAMSEKLTPEEVLSRLNEYLQVMTDVVFKNEGAVDKYIGDAVMALFGVPLFTEDHAQKAVTTAIEMQEALLILQDRWRAEGMPLIDIGIGINTGELVFGNMGANERRDFSVLGDTVNLASRVESLNKDMHSRILVTSSTYEIVRDTVRARGPLIAHVKGKEESVVVYEIFGWKEESNTIAQLLEDRPDVDVIDGNRSLVPLPEPRQI